MEFTEKQLTEIIAAANEVITALADENEDFSKSDTEKMIRAYDYLNDEAAPPEVVMELARIALDARQQYRKAACKPALNVQFKNGWPVEGTTGVFGGYPAFPDGYHDFYSAPQPLTDAEREELQQYRSCAAMLSFRENVNSSTETLREISETSTKCPFCGSSVKWCGEDEPDPEENHPCHHILCTNVDCGAVINFRAPDADNLPDNPEELDAMSIEDMIKPLRTECMKRFKRRKGKV